MSPVSVEWGHTGCLPSSPWRRLRRAAELVPGQHGWIPWRGRDQLHHLLDQWLGPLRPHPPLPPGPGVSAWDPPGTLRSAEPTLMAAVSPLRDFDSMDPQNAIRTHQMMLDVAEQELGIQPVLSSAEMATMAEPDRLGLITYLSQFYEVFRTSPGVRFWGDLSHPEAHWGWLDALLFVEWVPPKWPCPVQRWRSARSHCRPVAREGPSSSSASCRRAGT